MPPANDFLIKKPDGSTDTVTNVESFQFSDVTMTAAQLQAGAGTGHNTPRHRHRRSRIM